MYEQSIDGALANDVYIFFIFDLFNSILIRIIIYNLFSHNEYICIIRHYELTNELITNLRLSYERYSVGRRMYVHIADFNCFF